MPAIVTQQEDSKAWRAVYQTISNGENLGNPEVVKARFMIIS